MRIERCIGVATPIPLLATALAQPVFKSQIGDSIEIPVCSQQGEAMTEGHGGKQCVDRGKLPAGTAQGTLQRSGHFCLRLIDRVKSEVAFLHLGLDPGPLRIPRRRVERLLAHNIRK
jgi:hypothetical protein